MAVLGASAVLLTGACGPIVPSVSKLSILNQRLPADGGPDYSAREPRNDKEAAPATPQETFVIASTELGAELARVAPDHTITLDANALLNFKNAVQTNEAITVAPSGSAKYAGMEAQLLASPLHQIRVYISVKNAPSTIMGSDSVELKLDWAAAKNASDTGAWKLSMLDPKPGTTVDGSSAEVVRQALNADLVGVTVVFALKSSVAAAPASDKAAIQ